MLNDITKQLILRSVKAYQEATPEEQTEMYSHVKKLIDKQIYYSTYESHYLKAGKVFLRIYKSKHQ